MPGNDIATPLAGNNDNDWFLSLEQMFGNFNVNIANTSVQKYIWIY